MDRIIVVILLLIFCTINYAGESTFATYSNARFNFQVKYPLFLQPQGESANGDGQNFVGKNAILAVYGSFYPNLESQKNEDHFNIQDEFNYEKKELFKEGFQIGYNTLKGNFFVITGSNANKIVYLKKIFIEHCGVHLNLRLEYPKAEKKQWDDVVTKISHSFKYSSQSCQGDYKISEH